LNCKDASLTKDCFLKGLEHVVLEATATPIVWNSWIPVVLSALLCASRKSYLPSNLVTTFNFASYQEQILGFSAASPSTTRWSVS